MAALDIPDTRTIVAEFSLVRVIKEDGDIGTEFGMADMTPEEAIGYLTTVLDRIREEVRLAWDTCPGCGQPWSEHDLDDEDDEE